MECLVQIQQISVPSWESITCCYCCIAQLLDSRVSVLEDNGGNDGKRSITGLLERVVTLKTAATDHKTRLTTAKADIKGLLKILFGILYTSS